ncbi:LegC family aminotransferase [Pedobacter psychroterrae]|uniref:GDP-perosamine synthase n=1 Tax=Pedobacter psychroterrae TaxID=2530453 RepID=A0A4R0NRM9_9SPHI|nr:LegC family aminotransferase [Pedobacter psychroterrae]TCD02708.1 LegC family aminotransferase [Pedobacter psychroterrae]
MKDIQDIISFVQGAFGTKEFIPLHEPRFRGNEKKYVMDTIDSTFVSSVGAYVDKFEELMQTATGTQKAIAVVNGTAGLQVALRLAGVKSGDEVITQALTFIATANAIVYNGANPVFIDVDLDTMGLSPESVESFLSENAELRDDGCYNKKTGSRISACVPMHTFGFPVHMNELLKVCHKWNIPIVEDAAESLGSEYHGKQTGSLGQLGIFSFNGNKTITSGGGGAIVTNDLQIGTKAKYLTTTAKKPHPYEFYHDELGYNFRMPNLNAALACAQLEQLDTFLKNKRVLAREYVDYFNSIGVNFRQELPDTKANYWLMCVELENRDERDSFLKHTNESKVMTRPIWQLMFRLPMFENCMRDEQKNALFLEDRIVNVPSSVR